MQGECIAVPKHQYSIVLLARWETTTILEWLTYHKSIGFDHIYIYCNDDSPAELFDQVCCYLSSSTPFVTFIYYPFQGLQWDMYMHWLRTYSSETVWGAFLDADEFLALPGLDDIGQFMSRFSTDCDAVHFHWIYYGTNDFVERPPGSVLRQYTKREAKVSHETKNMIRTSRIQPERLRPHQTPFWHLWDNSHEHDLQCYSSTGKRFFVAADRQRIAAECADEIRSTAFIAHFAMKSEADFQRRIERGIGGQFAGQRLWAEVIRSGKTHENIAIMNAEYNSYLKDYWQRIVGTPKSTSIIPLPPGPNLAANRPATQSSISAWSVHQNPDLDAAGAVSGIVTGRFAFHTDNEEGPWWQVDLGKGCAIQEIRLYNRVDDMGVAARNANIVLLASDDGQAWHELYHRDSANPFGGADGNPLIWRANQPVAVRYLRLTAPTQTWLSLDQVEVYGPSDADLPRLGTALC